MKFLLPVFYYCYSLLPSVSGSPASLGMTMPSLSRRHSWSSLPASVMGGGNSSLNMSLVPTNPAATHQRPQFPENTGSGCPGNCQLVPSGWHTLPWETRAARGCRGQRWGVGHRRRLPVLLPGPLSAGGPPLAQPAPSITGLDHHRGLFPSERVIVFQRVMTKREMLFTLRNLLLGLKILNHLYLCACALCSVAQSCLTLCDLVDYSPPGYSVHWIFQNTGVGCHVLLQGIFLTQGSNLHLLHCRRIIFG